jgi:hypothetical protein
MYTGGMWWYSWLRHCTTNWKVAGSIPNGVIRIFHWHNPSGCAMALWSTQPLIEMSTRNINWGLRQLVCRADNLTTFICWLPEMCEPHPLGTLTACPGIVVRKVHACIQSYLPTYLCKYIHTYIHIYSENCFIHNWIIQESWLTSKLTEVKLTLYQVMEAQRGSRGIALLFLNLSTR